jgi:hypothetical protein
MKQKFEKKNYRFVPRSANLTQMVSSIVDENSEYHQNSMFAQRQSAWVNGGQTDQHMPYVQRMKK